MLGVVGGDHIVAEPALPLVDGQRAGEDLQQRRFAGAIGTDQCDAVAPFEGQVQFLVHHVVAVGLSHVVESDNFGTAAGRFRERIADLPGRSGQFDDFDFFQLFQPALHLPGLGRLVAEPLDETHLPLYLALLAGGGGLLDFQGALAGDQVIIVVSPMMDHFSRFNGEYAVGDLVQKGAVVGCDHHSAGKGGKILLEPQVCLKVEVVGRLVQQEQIGVPKQQPGQLGPHDPTAAELAHIAGEVAFLEAQARQDCLCFVVAVSPADGFQFRVESRQQIDQIALFGRIGSGRQIVPGCGNPVGDRNRFVVSAQYLLEQRPAGERRRFLPEVSHRGVAPPGY